MSESDTQPKIPNWADEAMRDMAKLEADVATGKMGLGQALAQAFLIGARTEIQNQARPIGQIGFTPAPVSPRRLPR